MPYRAFVRAQHKWLYSIPILLGSKVVMPCRAFMGVQLVVVNIVKRKVFCRNALSGFRGDATKIPKIMPMAEWSRNALSGFRGDATSSLQRGEVRFRHVVMPCRAFVGMQLST